MIITESTNWPSTNTCHCCTGHGDRQRLRRGDVRMQVEHELTRENVAKQMNARAIGCYQLGEIQNGRFLVRYIGRSTRSLQKRLLDHASNGKYKFFRYEECNSVKDTYDLECRWFHLHRDQLHNIRHPDSPRHLTLYSCKYCSKHPIRSYSLQLEVI